MLFKINSEFNLINQMNQCRPARSTLQPRANSRAVPHASSTCRVCSTALEGHLGVLGIAELIKIRLARELDHRGRAAHEDKRVGARAGEMCLDHVLGDEALRVLPAGGRAVHSVPEAHEAVGVLGLQGLEHVADENVVLSLVGIEEAHLGLIVGIAHDSGNHLEHGGDAGAAGHHAHVLDLLLLGANFEEAVALVLVHAPRARDSHLVAHLEACHVLRHLASIREAIDLSALVHLDNEVGVANVVVRRGGRVLALNLCGIGLGVLAPIPLPLHLARGVRCKELEVLAHGEAEDHVGLGQGKAEADGVMREHCALRQGYLLARLVQEDGTLLGTGEELTEEPQHEQEACGACGHGHRVRSPLHVCSVSGAGSLGRAIPK
mmetsp:Transcript_26395/g.71314  ORF Transcript_26395/g.71314 Transcript_26395/m.71314 type:complete len:378 (-) Transcript_26395:2-1135(-)